MKTTVIIPHYRTGALTRFTVNQFLACKGRHQLNIIVVDNGGGIGVEDIPKHPDVTLLTYPAELLQSHGLAYDHALKTVPGLIEECFITSESDSFPTHDRFLDHAEDWQNDGVDLAGSKLKLSGGTYLHPAGAMYRKSNWLEAMQTVREYGYHFYESMIPPCYHLMRKELIEGDDSVEKKRVRFLPISTGVFHQGMGFKDESVDTYGNRDMESEPPTILPRDGDDQYYRAMYEPGQWFSYWHKAMGKRIKEVPTEVRWLPGRENQNQEFSLMENGFKHLWGITAYSDCTTPELAGVVAFKRRQAAELFESMVEVEE